MNMLTEAKCAHLQDILELRLSDRHLVDMMTINAARALGVDDQIGSLEVGKKADILRVSGDRRRPYSTVIESNPVDVRGLFIDGVFQYGDTDVSDSSIAKNEFCERISLCETDKTICVKETAGEPNRFDKDDWARFGYRDIVNYVETVVQAQRPDGLSPALEYAYVPHPLECAIIRVTLGMHSYRHAFGDRCRW